jgi:hypothetical protein
MPDNTELLKQFQAVFGDKGGDIYPSNVGVGRTAHGICQEIMKLPDPELYEYFDAWNSHAEEVRKPHNVAFWLLRNGQWEGAWALAQLHYDQLLKQEIKVKKRLHKGHPLCNLAIVAREIDSPTLARHYAMLSSAGDIYWMHEDPHLRHGGYAPTYLERFESSNQQQAWRQKVETDLKAYATATPIYLEPFLAGRWFSDAYSQQFIRLAEMEKHGARPFVEVLLDAVENPGSAPPTTTGARFEAAAGLLMSSTPGFEVDSARKTTDEQVDLVVVYTPERLAQLGLEPGCGLVECKSSAGPVSVSELRDFGAKCLFHRVEFGILVARAGVTGRQAKTEDLFKDLQHAELTRRRFQVDGLTLLVLDITHLRGKSRELRGLVEELRADYRELVFGPVA